MRLSIALGLCVLVGTTLVLQAQQPTPPASTPPAASPTTPTEADTPPEAAAPAKTPAPVAKDGKAAKAEKPKSPPAKEFFGAAKTASPLASRAIGFYAKGCLAGGKPLPVDGPAWQAMRLSRNRNWGHPELVELVKKLATEAKQHDSWPGLLVGDLAQPRGGPMTSGHASHQVGLDADIWLTPMPDRTLSHREREDMSATSMLKSWDAVDPAIWTERHAKLIKRAASYTEVERIFVHPAIKKALCEGTPKDASRAAWLSKVRPMYGHNYHFHIRIHCPKGSTNCEAQPPVGHDDGCGQDLTKWLALVKPRPRPPTPPGPTAPPPAGKPPITLDELPADCRNVLASGPDGVKQLPDPVKTAVGKLQKSAGAAKSKTK